MSGTMARVQASIAALALLLWATASGHERGEGTTAGLAVAGAAQCPSFHSIFIGSAGGGVLVTHATSGQPPGNDSVLFPGSQLPQHCGEGGCPPTLLPLPPSQPGAEPPAMVLLQPLAGGAALIALNHTPQGGLSLLAHMAPPLPRPPGHTVPPTDCRLVGVFDDSSRSRVLAFFLCDSELHAFHLVLGLPSLASAHFLLQAGTAEHIFDPEGLENMAWLQAFCLDPGIHFSTLFFLDGSFLLEWNVERGYLADWDTDLGAGLCGQGGHVQPLGERYLLIHCAGSDASFVFDACSREHRLFLPGSNGTVHACSESGDFLAISFNGTVSLQPPSSLLNVSLPPPPLSTPSPPGLLITCIHAGQKYILVSEEHNQTHFTHVPATGPPARHTLPGRGAQLHAGFLLTLSDGPRSCVLDVASAAPRLLACTNHTHPPALIIPHAACPHAPPSPSPTSLLPPPTSSPTSEFVSPHPTTPPSSPLPMLSPTSNLASLHMTTPPSPLPMLSPTSDLTSLHTTTLLLQPTPLSQPQSVPGLAIGLPIAAIIFVVVTGVFFLYLCAHPKGPARKGRASGQQDPHRAVAVQSGTVSSSVVGLGASFDAEEAGVELYCVRPLQRVVEGEEDKALPQPQQASASPPHPATLLVAALPHPPPPHLSQTTFRPAPP